VDSPAPKGEHLYYKLSSKNPEYKNQHLGKAGSEKYRDWRARIQRWEASAELEQQLSMLQALIDRQAAVMVEILPAATIE
jgi:protein subunit release factor B